MINCIANLIKSLIIMPFLKTKAFHYGQYQNAPKILAVSTRTNIRNYFSSQTKRETAEQKGNSNVWMRVVWKAFRNDTFWCHHFIILGSHLFNSGSEWKISRKILCTGIYVGVHSWQSRWKKTIFFRSD